MTQRIRLLLLLAAVTLILALAGAPSVSAAHGLICGGPDDPIPCSTFNTASCVYSYDRAANCCYAQSGCLGHCC
ncbi:MAG: hypothetical protein ACJ76N_16990 [Thermoanaerobaculia bacterium]